MNIMYYLQAIWKMPLTIILLLMELMILYWLESPIKHQALPGTVEDTFKGCSYDFRSKCYYGVGRKSQNILEFSSVRTWKPNVSG